ncbi:hypothetical protein D3C75_232760 [compost metagenome]
MKINVYNISFDMTNHQTIRLPIDTEKLTEIALETENVLLGSLYSLQVMAARAYFILFVDLKFDYRIVEYDDQPFVDKAVDYQVANMDMINSQDLDFKPYHVDVAHSTTFSTVITYDDIRSASADSFDTEDDLIKYIIFCKLTDYLPISFNLTAV